MAGVERHPAPRFETMSTGIMERHLVRSLGVDAELSGKGCQAAIAPAGGVIVLRRGQVQGIWAWRNGAFVLERPGVDTPMVEVETIAEAVRHTREQLFQGP